MQSIYYRQLIHTVINNSVCQNWLDARTEWVPYGYRIDNTCTTQCICGKDHIKYIYWIINSKNQKILKPIGSTCINKFGSRSLDQYVHINSKLQLLADKVNNNEYIEFNHRYFDDQIIQYMYDQGAFGSTTGKENTLNFLRNMLKNEKRTDKQKRKIKAIIVLEIKPYLKKFYNSSLMN